MLQKIVEGRNVSYVAPLNKSIEDYPLFMDATRIIEDAIRRDRKPVAGHPDGYDREQGPHYAIEHQRVTDYVNYVMDKINRENFYKFDSRNYRFFLGSVQVRKPAP
jgi:hypothetical protein